MKRRIVNGTILGTVGYILSPLSWWNDPFVNIPLAYAAAWAVSLLYKPAFGTTFVASYWLTNIAGFFLMHKGICKMVREDCSNRDYFRKDFVKDLGAALFYTLLIIVLIKINVLQPIGDYFTPR